MTDHTAPSAVKPPSAGYRAWVLLMLFVVYAFNFLDRQIISILAEPIKLELDLTDRQLGLLGGTAILCAYILMVGAGLRIALRADSAFDTLLATGLTTLLGIQAFIIILRHNTCWGQHRIKVLSFSLG